MWEIYMEDQTLNPQQNPAAEPKKEETTPVEPTTAPVIETPVEEVPVEETPAQ
jgi:hypothetical protein